MPYALQHIDGQRPGEILPIVSNSLTLGRSQGDLLLEDSEVSGKHCSVQMLAGELLLVDHGSRNGTYLNGTRTDRSKLRPGDIVKVGSSEFRIIEWPMGGDFQDPITLVERWSESLQKLELSSFTQSVAQLIKKEIELCLNDVHLKLTLESKDGRVVNHLVPVNEIILGRSGTVPLLAEDEEASRKHARVFVDSRACIQIEDLNSANGSFVNEERIVAPRRVKPGDMIRLGKTRIQVALFLPEFSAPIEL
ncbi:FHA domain-containing protein [bacterium]|nr:FHA domain-containing protein [bacterium]